MLVILPGNSKKANERWLNDSAKTFSDPEKTGEVYTQPYTHWETGEKIINFDVELEKLSKALEGQENYVIFAKSAGAMLTVYGVSKGVLKPERCVFVGLPMKWAKENNFFLPEWLENFDASTLIFEQTEDPFASFTELQEILQKLGKENITLEEIPGNDHKYEDFSLFKERAMEFLMNKEKEKENMHEGDEKLNLK